MARRSLSLLLVAVVLLAGCLGTPGQTATDSDTPAQTDTPPQTPGPDAAVEWPDGPKAQPEIPDTLTESSVREFIKAHEYRYAYNSLWYGEGSTVSLECSVETVMPAGDGYEALAQCTGYSNTREETTGTGTATQVHADWFTQRFRYYVSDGTVRRMRANE